MILSRGEVTLLGKIVDVLEVFTTFTKYIQGNSYPTLNSLVLFYVEIKQSLEQLKEANTCDVIGTVIDILLNNLDKRFQLTDASIAAAVLDPSTQHLPEINSWLESKGMFNVFFQLNCIAYKFQIEVITMFCLKFVLFSIISMKNQSS